MGISIDVIRVGRKYALINFGETFEFEVMEALDGENFLLKDLHTLEKYTFQSLISLGKGSDFEIDEIDE